MNRSFPRGHRLAVLPVPGFTLLEMLLAVLIFGLMASTAYGVLNAISAATAAQESSAGRLRDAQLAVLRIERELRQTLSTGMLSSAGAPGTLQGGQAALEFSFLAPPTAGVGSSIRPVRYQYEDRTLFRIPAGSGPARQGAVQANALLDGVLQLRFSYLDSQGQWRSRWEPATQGGLPMAVRLEVEIERLGHVERLFELPGDRP